ncbi:MAG: Eco29kI family restriction endonuclease, partial [Pseudomonadota bacterium]
GPISGTETPIYVGKADPPKDGPKTVIDQGTKLFSRLNEHRRNIEKVAGIEIEDFECRALAVQSGYQEAAESHLIRLFVPIWNNETKILFGLGKHGDSSETRANKRSPFDTLHPGRAWAEGNEPARTAEEIIRDAKAHFERTKVYQDMAEVFAAFVENIRQEDRLEPGYDAAS